MSKIDEYKQRWMNAPITVGDSFRLKTSSPDIIYYALGMSSTKLNSFICDSNKDDRLRITINSGNSNIYKSIEDYPGYNPFTPNIINFTGYSLENILSILGYERNGNRKNDDGGNMPYVNFNPYFVVDGKKEYYQRGYVWKLEHKQALIDSICRGLEIGRIIVHYHDWDYQEKMVNKGFVDFASRDIVDGKQRLLTMIGFINDEFVDYNGVLHSEYSDDAKRNFRNYSGMSYGEIKKPCTPKEIAEIFLNNVVQGVPLSEEHIKYMKDLRNKL